MKLSSLKSLLFALLLILLCIEPVAARAGGGGGKSKSKSSTTTTTKSRSKSKSSSSGSTKKKAPVIVTKELATPMTIAVAAHMYYVSVDSLKKLNSDLINLKESDTLHQASLRVPKKTSRKSHYVLEGDTWESVATKYEVEVEKLKKANEKFVTGDLVAGQTVFMPVNMVANILWTIVFVVVSLVLLFYGARLYFKFKK